MRRTPLLPTTRTPFLATPTFVPTPRPLSPQPQLRRAMSQRAFQLRLDPLTGTSEWIVVEDRDGSEPPPNPNSPLLSSTSYLDMLNDSRRNAAFHRAIRSTVAGSHHVIDIGAGTGLLSMMAARAMEGERGGKVTAFESYLPMVKLMRKVLRANGMEQAVRVIPRRSDDAVMGVDVDSRADVLVSEILDSELLGEGLIPTLQHAHDMLLEENPLTVPYHATVYAQLVESTFLWKLHDLYGCEVEATDSLRLTPSNMERIICIEPKQHAMQCSAISSEIRLVSEPFRVFDFDFSKRPESQGKIDLQIKAVENGTVHAVISWWVLQLDSSGSTFYSTAPDWIDVMNNEKEAKSKSGEKDWCDHWKQCVWFVPGRGITASKGSFISFQAMHDNTSISYSLENGTEVAKNPHQENGVGYSQLLLSPERIGLYGDNRWRSVLLASMKNALEAKVSPLCLVADDSVFLTVATVHVSRRSYVMSAFPGLHKKVRAYLEEVADVSNVSKNQIEVLGRRASSLTFEDLHQRKVDILMAEPFYIGNEGTLPWQNLRFWKERTLLDPLLSEGAFIMPCKAILKACAMSLPDLWQSRHQISSIEGFDHAEANGILGACGNMSPVDIPCLPYFIWQCGEIKVLSKMMSVMEFDFSEAIHECSGKVKVRFSSPGTCHGLALWIDWVLDEKNSTIISTGPDSRYWKQGVKLLSKPVVVNTPASCSSGECCVGEIEASFNPTTGDLDVKALFFP